LAAAWRIDLGRRNQVRQVAFLAEFNAAVAGGYGESIRVAGAGDCDMHYAPAVPVAPTLAVAGTGEYAAVQREHSARLSGFGRAVTGGWAAAVAQRLGLVVVDLDQIHCGGHATVGVVVTGPVLNARGVIFAAELRVRLS
jgi:hypothetical protein